MPYSPKESLELAGLLDTLAQHPELPPNVNADHAVGAAMIESSVGFTAHEVNQYRNAIDRGEKALRAAYRHLGIVPDFRHAPTPADGAPPLQELPF